MTKHQANNPSKTSQLLGKAHCDSENHGETVQQKSRQDDRRGNAEGNIGNDEEE